MSSAHLMMLGKNHQMTAAAMMTSSAIAIGLAELPFLWLVDFSDCFLAAIALLDFDGGGEYHGVAFGLFIEKFTEDVLNPGIDGASLHGMFEGVD